MTDKDEVSNDHTEDIAIRCKEIAPNRFRWQLHDYPDKDLVRKALVHASESKNGSLVMAPSASYWTASYGTGKGPKHYSDYACYFTEQGTALPLAQSSINATPYHSDN
jgi:hypothetical protein